ncbi:LysR family transcriptional regulator [Aliidongia dinghuensis]|uniref:LysR family transcriptional regulator n=1 Tax=Aliidongia dinghuensis TaxID=1867774 RepID=A0A8J2YV83_9PROT|nr:LysR substrate-binding domain-containing protein [Aliidongia dinghuensis]GGF20675.1 LysR family transcriptional regulator [Aliidongia dinghuensis]
MSLNLHLLRLFAAVARHQSFSRAAEALHLSQPAVSKGVRDFEAQVGSRLLERGAGGVTLTEAGALLMRHATQLFAAERAAEEDLAALRGLERGTLSIGASTTVATYQLPPLLGLFHRRHPEIELRLTSANTRAIADLLSARELDIALIEGPVEEPGIEVVPWREEEMILIAAPDHALARATAPIAAAALANEIVLVREPGSGTREVALAALESHRIVPRQILEVGSTEAIKQIVAGGLGIAIVSAAAAADQIALGKLVALSTRDFAVRRQLTRLRLPGRQPSAPAAVFEALLDQAPD